MSTSYRTDSRAEEQLDKDTGVLVEAELRRRRAIRRMRGYREALQKSNPQGFNQEAVSKRMGLAHGQPTIARLESGTADPTLLTMERYAASLGAYIDMCLVDANGRRLTEPASVQLKDDAASIDSGRDLAAQEHPFSLPDDLKERFPTSG